MKHPPLQWAQRRDCVFITIPVQDTEDIDINVGTVFKINFFVGKGPNAASQPSAEGDDDPRDHYACEIPLFSEVMPEQSKSMLNARQIGLRLTKKTEGVWWPRLTVAGYKNRHISVDWNRWMEDDDEGSMSASGVADEDDAGEFKALQEMMAESRVKKDAYADPTAGVSFAEAKDQKPMSQEEIDAAEDAEMPPLEEE